MEQSGKTSHSKDRTRKSKTITVNEAEGLILYTFGSPGLWGGWPGMGAEGRVGTPQPCLALTPGPVLLIMTTSPGSAAAPRIVW